MRAAERRGRRAVTGLVVVAALVAGLPALAQVNPLPPDKAFRFSARVVDAQTVEARFIIAEGYYLYRDKIHFVIEPATAGLMGSRRVVRLRRSRLLACPRSPSRIMLCRERIALTIWGMTESS